MENFNYILSRIILSEKRIKKSPKIVTTRYEFMIVDIKSVVERMHHWCKSEEGKKYIRKSEICKVESKDDRTPSVVITSLIFYLTEQGIARYYLRKF